MIPALGPTSSSPAWNSTSTSPLAAVISACSSPPSLA